VNTAAEKRSSERASLDSDGDQNSGRSLGSASYIYKSISTSVIPCNVKSLDSRSRKILSRSTSYGGKQSCPLKHFQIRWCRHICRSMTKEATSFTWLNTLQCRRNLSSDIIQLQAGITGIFSLIPQVFSC